MLKLLYLQLKSNGYGYFIFKSFLLVAAVLVIDLLVGSTLRYFYFNQSSGEQYRATYAMEQTTADLIIFGSSRANHHYHPDVFEKRLKKSYYNVGRDGNFLFYHYAVLKSILARHQPEVIILDVVAQEFVIDPSNYDRISSLLPYYKTHPEIRDIVEMKSSTERLKLISKIYPFNSSLFAIAIGNTELNKKRRPDIKGYVPMMETAAGPIQKNEMPVHYEIDSTKLKIYESFIKDCKAAGIRLYIVSSPYLIRFNQPIYSIALAKKIAQKNDVPFFDYSNDPLFINNPRYFADESHLNDFGARIFSESLIAEMNKIPK